MNPGHQANSVLVIYQLSIALPGASSTAASRLALALVLRTTNSFRKSDEDSIPEPPIGRLDSPSGDDSCGDKSHGK